MIKNDNRKSIEKKFHDDYFSRTRNCREKQKVYYPKEIKKIEGKFYKNDKPA